MNNNMKTKIIMLVAVLCIATVVTPTVAGEWYFKPAYPNYAPSGMPDFNQTQDTWMKGGQWTFCGPVAVANCFWWFDSKYADPTGMPGDGADTFLLVQNYGAPFPVWGPDDHDPANIDDATTPPGPNGELVEQLAWYMDTDGMRTGGAHYGTDVHVMEQCIDDWLNATGLNRTFYEHKVKEPDFYYIEEEIKRCQDVILLLGFWECQYEPDGWVRIGGHYVTCAGVDSENRTIAFSDPFFDNAVATGFGHIVPNPHPIGYSAMFHNDAQYISHDYYVVAPDSISPGGIEYIPDYPVTLQPELCMNFWPMNVPPEFVDNQSEWQYGAIHTEIEYAVLISPLVLTPFLIDGWVDCTNGDPVNGPSVTVTNLNTGEVFIAETDASSNYYQIVTSSDTVRAGNVLRFNVSKGNSTEFDHPVTVADMNAGGFMQNATIECGGQPGLCGDANDDGVVDMTDVMTVWYDFADYPTPGAYTISNEWAADVNCDETIDMTDVMTIWYDFADYPTPGAYEVNCC